MSYTFIAANSDGGASPDSYGLSVNIGAVAGPTVFVAAGLANAATTAASCSVGGVSLTSRLFYAPAFTLQFFSGPATGLSGTQIATVTWPTGQGSFVDKSIFAWYTTDNVSIGTTSSTTADALTMSVSSGNYLFTMGALGGQAAAWDFNGSTQTPTGNRNTTDADYGTGCGDWAIATTNAAFSIVPTPGFSYIIGVSYSVVAPPTIVLAGGRTLVMM